MQIELKKELQKECTKRSKQKAKWDLPISFKMPVWQACDQINYHKIRIIRYVLKGAYVQWCAN